MYRVFSRTAITLLVLGIWVIQEYPWKTQIPNTSKVIACWRKERLKILKLSQLAHASLAAVTYLITSKPIISDSHTFPGIVAPPEILLNLLSTITPLHAPLHLLNKDNTSHQLTRLSNNFHTPLKTVTLPDNCHTFLMVVTYLTTYVTLPWKPDTSQNKITFP